MSVELTAVLLIAYGVTMFSSWAVGYWMGEKQASRLFKEERSFYLRGSSK